MAEASASGRRKPLHRGARNLFIAACCAHAALLALLFQAWSRYGSDRAPEPSPREVARLSEVFGGEYVFPGYAYQGVTRSSLYLTMRDGERMALDLYLPEGLAPEARIPALLLPTRYWRRWDLRPPAAWYLGPDLFTKVFVNSGYAVLMMDVRGSGASTGHRLHPWSADEVADYGEVIDWAAIQPWCNGNVGTTGISYGGTCAEFAASLGRPALKAAAPRFSLFDAYADIAFPGGVLNDWFVSRWGRFNAVLDQGRIPGEAGFLGEMLLQGLPPVDCPPGISPGRGVAWCGQPALEAALRDHGANVDIYAAALGATCRDDYQAAARTAVDGFSPHAVVREAGQGGAAVYGWSGWMDGGYAASVIHRFRTLTNPSRAVIGPWNHAGGEHVSPFLDQDAATDPSPLVQLLELRRFFDFYLKGEGTEPCQEIIYYTLGEERWKRSPVWPPAGATAQRLHLSADHGLSWEPPRQAGGADRHPVDFSAGSGESNRWRTQLNRADVAYPRWAESDARRLVYASEPLARPLEITGTATVTVHLESTAGDGALFAYLEAEDAEGNVRLLTEGMLRFLHRRESPDRPYAAVGPWHSFLSRDAEPYTPGEVMELRVGLLPVSVRLEPGSRVRLALAGADADQFARLPAQGEAVFTIHRGGEEGSWLELPVIP